MSLLERSFKAYVGWIEKTILGKPFITVQPGKEQKSIEEAINEAKDAGGHTNGWIEEDNHPAHVDSSTTIK